MVPVAVTAVFVVSGLVLFTFLLIFAEIKYLMSPLFSFNYIKDNIQGFLLLICNAVTRNLPDGKQLKSKKRKIRITLLTSFKFSLL